MAQTLEVLRLEGGHWLIVSTSSATDIVRAEPFDAADVDLSDLWERT